ncbi:hypothetical protein DVQ41_17670, partial [Yersinia enterocolitica]|nr:hypothetical protein [Yersinia enterocolitica]
MRINPILLISILTFISIKTSHSREAEPKHHFNKESFSQYQARHCKWETGYTCKDVPKDQGMPPPRTSEEIALEVGLGLLAGGPTPQPKGFKFSIGKLPIKTTAKVPATPKPGTITERTPLLSTTAKPKAKGTIRRVNGKIGYLLGDPEAPQLGEEPPIKRVRVVESESESESESE